MNDVIIGACSCKAECNHECDSSDCDHCNPDDHEVCCSDDIKEQSLGNYCHYNFHKLRNNYHYNACSPYVTIILLMYMSIT